MGGALQKLGWLHREFGLASVVDSGRDAWIIILQRSLRMFAFGTNSLVLALFFASLDFSDYQIGAFMTLTLAGEVILGTLLTLVADRIGRRRVLLAGSCLMIFSGFIFALFENFWILLFAAVVGVITVTGGDFGPFRAIEESMVSGLVGEDKRSDVLSWYVTFSSLGSSIGSEVSGRLVHSLEKRDGWTLKDAYHFLFWIYAAMGIANFLFVLCLSEECELQRSSVPARTTATEAANEEEEIMLVSDSESDTLSVHEEPETPTTPTAAKPYLPSGAASSTAPSRFRRALGFLGNGVSDISAPTRKIMYKLCVLLALDSMADGMVPYTLTNYYMDSKFGLPKSTLGDVMSASYLLASLSTVFAAPLARRLGLVNTMVYTHVPSSAAVLLFPFAPSAALTILLLLVRAGLNNMDQAPRSAFVAAAVRPHERTAVMGITSMLRTLSATVGPSITGILAGNDRFWIAFVAAGLFRLAYDFGLWALFRNFESSRAEKGEARARAGDEEEGQEMGKL